MRERGTTVLVVDGGGRGAALVDKYAQSDHISRVLAVPGNDLMGINTDKEVKIFPERYGKPLAPTHVAEILEICHEERVDLVDVAQDEPLAAGLVDVLDVEKIKAFGPTQSAAEIEWNKIWSRKFMERYKLPTPTFSYFSNPGEAIKYVNALSERTLYIKAAGLAAGKGVIRAGNKVQAKEAILAMKQFGKSGKKFLVEEAMVGEEFSAFAICDGEHYKIVGWAQDHKTLYEGDRGPNTGGMGCVAPAKVSTSSIVQTIELKILKVFVKGMQKEGRPYKGVLYLGGMLTNPPAGGGVKIVEFNARWGDPEAEVILPSIQTDYLEILQMAMDGTLDKLSIKLDNKVRISVAGCCRGYPGDYSQVKGKEIFGLGEAMKLSGITIFGAGIKRRGRRFFANGGRVFHLVTEGKNILEARKKAYEAISLISIEGNNLHYRTDIGWRDVDRLRKVS